MDSEETSIPVLKLNLVTAAVLNSALTRYVTELQEEAFLAFVSGDLGKFTRRMAVLSQALPLAQGYAETMPDNATDYAVEYFRQMCEMVGE